MPAQSKFDQVEKIVTSINNATGVFVVDYCGLSVKEAEQLRRVLREAQAEMKVYKNNLVKIALEKTGRPAIDDILVGTTACTFYKEDPVAAAKAIKQTAQSLGKIEFKGGIIKEAVISAADAYAIADLPGREELIAHVVGSLSNPLAGTVRALGGIATGLVTALSAVADLKKAA